MVRTPPTGDYANFFAPPVAQGPTATPWGGRGAQVDANGQVINGINPITGRPLGPNEGGSISGGYNPTTGQVYPVVPGSPAGGAPSGVTYGPPAPSLTPYDTIAAMLQPRPLLTAALQMPGQRITP